MKLMNLFLISIVLFLIYKLTDFTNHSIIGTNAHDMNQIWNHAPPSVTMTEYLLKWSEQENVPYRMVKNASRLETNFKGLLHWDYTPDQTSSANAEGPMQILLPTAQYMNPGVEFDREYLRNNIPFNTETGTRYAKHLFDTYGDWLKVWSFYNQGAVGLTSINSYARYVAFNGKIM